MSNEKEIYKNSPLVEVVFEIRFHGEPSVECNRDKFFDKVRDVYPNVLVPKFSEGKSIALEPYRFEDIKGLCGIMVAINKLALYCKNYKGFAVFKAEVLRVFSIFGELYKIDKINRTGLRYINVIPFAREKNIIPLQNYLNIEIKMPKDISTEFENLGIVFVSKTERGNITTRIEPMISIDRDHEVISLDFDYAIQDNLSFKKIENYIDESHKHTKYLFENLITESYKKFLKGELI